MRGGAAGIVCLALVAACAPGSDLPIVTQARIGQPTGAHGALYMTVSGYGASDRLVAASTTVAGSVELHESVLAADGTASMRKLDHIDLAARGSLVLEPGGLHLMLLDVDRLAVGSVVEITLMWEHAGEMTVEAIVVDPADILEEHDGHDH